MWRARPRSAKRSIPKIDIGRARQDEEMRESNTAILREIAMAFPIGSRARDVVPYGAGELGPVMSLLEAPVDSMPPERYERGLSYLLDHERVPPLERLTTLLSYAQKCEFLVLEAQARRGLGSFRADPIELGRALDQFNRAGAVPYAARVRCERALMTGDRIELDAGLHVLEGLGDIDQLGRYQRRAIG